MGVRTRAKSSGGERRKSRDPSTPRCVGMLEEGGKPAGKGGSVMSEQDAKGGAIRDKVIVEGLLR